MKIEMSKKTVTAWGTAAAVFFVLAASAAAQTDFSLTPYTRAAAPELKTALAGLQPDSDEAPAKPEEKHPWTAGFEVAAVNIGVWLWDRYVANLDYSHISWKSIQYNFSHGFIWDLDSLSLGFFAHPYHGSIFFNAARTNGLTFWESIPYAAGGYLVWGFIFENDQPSYNDLLITTMGGTFLGETFYRISSLILNDIARSGGAAWREVLAALVDPARGANRLGRGESGRGLDENAQIREPLEGSLAIGDKIVSRQFNLSNTQSGVGGDFGFFYGDVASPKSSSRDPFSLIVWDSGLRRAQGQTYYDIESFAFIAGKQTESSNGQQNLFGLFQDYEFLKNEIVNTAGTALTGGIVSLFPLGGGMSIKTSVQIGLQFGGSDNPYVRLENRDFNYGWGGIGKAETWLDFAGFGRLDLRFRYSQLFSVDQAIYEINESHDFLTHFLARYDLPVAAGLGLRLEYSTYGRHLNFEYHPSQKLQWSLLGASLVWMF
jgi:hypothetical protein